jgi:Rieske Fe-S protein
LGVFVRSAARFTGIASMVRSSQYTIPAMHERACDRRALLRTFVSGGLAALGAGLATVLGAFALRPPAGARRTRWVKAATLAELQTDRPFTALVSVSRQQGWYRERAPEAVLLTWDGESTVRAFSATCTHLGCRVSWNRDAKTFRCPCHGGVYDANGRVVAGPPPRPLATIDARIDKDGGVLVKL